MPFKFAWFCELLDDLVKNRHHHATTIARSQNPDHRIIISWFNKYDSKISRVGNSAIALLSALFPERRVDRVYNLQEKRLSAIFGRALGLGHARASELNRWRCRDGADFATCVERVMAQCEFDVPSAEHEVTIEEVDCMLHEIAANSPFSAFTIRSARSNKSTDEILTSVLRRLHSREAKWLVRMLLKSYIEVQIPERIALSHFHFMLPYLLSMQNSFKAAVDVLGKTSIVALPPRPNKEYEKPLLMLVAKDVSPKIGIMIQRQPYLKARSIKHCCNMANKRQMSVERKYDGEYCQIHIDLVNGQHCIQIYSKSGKDSTQDRIGLHRCIKDCLKIGKDDCRIKRHCIIEGELLVWSSYRKCILPFYKIRKYAWHGGRRLGTAADSPLRSDEHLMIAFYDVLLLDDKPLLNESLTVRRRYLENLIHPIEGHGILGEREIINFSFPNASKKLRHSFGKAIAQRWEGFVLKACDEPFLSWQTVNHGIKLKKDYITGLGDSADLCIVGGRRDARVESELGLGPLRWTSFHVGCLVNKSDVRRYNAMPHLKVLDELTHHSMPKTELLDLNKLGVFHAATYSSESSHFSLDFPRPDMRKPAEVFRVPFIIEVMGAGYERPSNCNFYALRFPRKVDGKVKLHSDRSIVDTTSFEELQEMARNSMNPTTDDDLQEDEAWIRKLLQADGKSQSTQTSPGVLSPHTVSSHLNVNSPMLNGRPLRASRPVFVRADTEELLQHESLENRSQQSASQHIHDSDSSYRRGLKRAAAVLKELQQPRIGKKPCLTSTASRTNQSGNEDITYLASNGSHAEVPFVDEQENCSLASEVNESPDITGEESSTITLQSPSAVLALRQAHASLSPAVVGCDYHSATQVHFIRQSAVNGSKQVSSSPLSSISMVVVNAQQHDDGNLLGERKTPPVAHDGLLTTPRRLQMKQQSHSTDLRLDHAGDRSSRNTRPKTIGSIYIASSVSRTSSLYSRSQLYESLRSMSLSYTHILDAFLDQMSATSSFTDHSAAQQFHMVLVDFDNPQSAKGDLDELFNHLVLRSRVDLQHRTRDRNHTGDQSGVSPISLLEGMDIMIWDFSVITHLNTREASIVKPRSYPFHKDNKAILRTKSLGDVGKARLAKLKDDPVGVELFGGFMCLHQRTWIEKRVLRYYLVKDWTWTLT